MLVLPDGCVAATAGRVLLGGGGSGRHCAWPQGTTNMTKSTHTQHAQDNWDHIWPTTNTSRYIISTQT